MNLADNIIAAKKHADAVTELRKELESLDRLVSGASAEPSRECGFYPSDTDPTKVLRCYNYGGGTNYVLVCANAENAIAAANAFNAVYHRELTARLANAEKRMAAAFAGIPPSTMG